MDGLRVSCGRIRIAPSWEDWYQAGLIQVPALSATIMSNTLRAVDVGYDILKYSSYRRRGTSRDLTRLELGEPLRSMDICHCKLENQLLTYTFPIGYDYTLRGVAERLILSMLRTAYLVSGA